MLPITLLYKDKKQQQQNNRGRVSGKTPTAVIQTARLPLHHSSTLTPNMIKYLLILWSRGYLASAWSCVIQ